MFPGPSHSRHSNIWMVPLPSCRNNVTCIACLLDVMNNANVSLVQKQMSLDILKTLVTESDITLQLLAADQDICCHIIDIITVCVAVVHKLQDISLFEILMDKFQRTVLLVPSERKTQFFLLVFDQFCHVSLMYSRILLSSQMNTISHLLSNHEFLEVDTTSFLAHLLVKLLTGLPSNSDQYLMEADTFLWKVMTTLVTWLNTATSKNFQANCLDLLKELLELQDVTSGLLHFGQHNQQGHSLLMGLKKILVTKDKSLVFAGTQCLTRLLESLKEPEYIKEVFDTDLAEFVFELLHSSDTTQLKCVLQCLNTMINHQQFFDRCHAVYGLDSTVLAIQEVLDNGRPAIVETGLSFLKSLIRGQPESMPLFVNLSWTKTCHLLRSCLQHKKLSLFLAALKTTEAFLGTTHQQTPIDLTSVTILLRTALDQCELHLKMQSENSKEEQFFNTVNSMSDVVLANVELVSREGVLCGNMEEHIQELKTVIRDVCSNLIIPWIVEHWHYLSDSSRIDKFLACLDVHLSADGQNQQSMLLQVVTKGLPCHILCLHLQTHIPDDTRKLMGHVLAGLFLQLAKYLRPHLELNEEILISGFSKINWHEVQPGKKGVEKMSSKEEVVTCFCLLYISYHLGYRYKSMVDGSLLLTLGAGLCFIVCTMLLVLPGLLFTVFNGVFMSH